MASFFAIIRYALLETFFCIPILPKTVDQLPYIKQELNHFDLKRCSNWHTADYFNDLLLGASV